MVRFFYPTFLHRVLMDIVQLLLLKCITAKFFGMVVLLPELVIGVAAVFTGGKPKLIL